MITCYDYSFASIIATTDIDLILVGDSSAMTMHGMTDTTHATIEMIASMVAATTRGAPNKFVVADMPFLTHRKGKIHALECAEKLVRAGAQAIKIEGILGHEDTIAYLIESGIPVMGHLGLTPQSVLQQGYQVQGKSPMGSDAIIQQALALQDIGCFAVVLECVPSQCAKTITEELLIPTIGIGAGVHTDGQVIVLQDALGMNTAFKPKFVRQFAHGFEIIQGALNQFSTAVKERTFPNTDETYYP